MQKIVPPLMTEEENKEFIICACNWYDDKKYHNAQPKNILTGFVICGHRHFNCIQIFASIVKFPYTKKALALSKSEKQGFLTNTNRWVDRVEALGIAQKSNQIITGDGNSTLGLFSEDLY